MTDAGWYPDRTDAKRERYWDGSHWTAATRPTTAVAPPRGPHALERVGPDRVPVQAPPPVAPSGALGATSAAGGSESAAERRSRRSLPFFALAAIVLAVLVATSVTWYMVSRDSGTGQPPFVKAATPRTDARSGTAAPDPNSGDGATKAPGSQTQVSTIPVVASIAATSTAVDGIDACQPPHEIGYVAANAIDNDPTTAWRVPGSGVGQQIVLHLAAVSHVTSVGLIPGYAKVDPCDGSVRFNEERRVTSVQWTIGDHIFTQTFTDSPVMQSIPVDAVGGEVSIKILGDTGPALHDFTPISEISVG